MKIAIMQPTYLPWIGYFNLIKNVDKFIFLDDVQFSKQSWQQRNRILFNNNYKFLTVPVDKKSSSKLIKDIKIYHNSPWKQSHLGMLKQTYNKHDFFNDVFGVLEEILLSPVEYLVDLNLNFIKIVSEKLDLNPEFHFSSDIEVFGKRSEYLIKICENFNADKYLSPIGSKEYIEEEGLFKKSGIKVEYQNFKHPVYPQKNSTEFLPYLSIVDLLFNVGFREARGYL